ncbi:MAG: nitrous oxide reductase accessory protein NosL [Phycisphaerales bacterium JB043]
MTTRHTTRALAIGLVTSLTACAPGELSGPPEILLDEHVCDQCNMIISDERFASASLVHDDRRGNEYKRFDDLNCLINFERGNPDVDVLHRWVHDYTTLEWLDARRAVFLRSAALHTPMGSNLAAHTTSDDAMSLKNELGGEIQAYEDVWRSQ